MSTGIFMPMTKCVHDIPYHGWTHETNSSSSLVFICNILNSRTWVAGTTSPALYELTVFITEFLYTCMMVIMIYCP